MNITNEDLRRIIKEEVAAVYNQFGDLKVQDPCVWMIAPEHRPDGMTPEEAEQKCKDKEAKSVEEAKKKKACKPSKGKRFAKRVDGKCRSYGQKGQAKSGGDRIRPGTKKGDAYCARSAKIKKCKNPPCANALSRKKWKCRGSKSMK